MRKVPKKNYFILLILLAVTAGIVFFACDIYESRTQKQYSSVMNSFVTEIKLDDLNGYTLENSPVVIFISNKLDVSLEEMESKYKELLTKHNIQHLFVYLDISDATVLTTFNEKYGIALTAEKLPILVVINEGSALDFYSNVVFVEDEIVDFLEINGVIESD